MRSTLLTPTRGSRKRLATGTLVLSLVCVAAVATAANVEVLMHATVDFWDRYLKDDQKALGRLSSDVAVQGVNLVSVNNTFSFGALKCEACVMP